MEMKNIGEASGIEQRSADEHHKPGPKPPTRTSAASGLATPPVGRWAKVHWALLLVALVPLVVAGQGQHFFYDEWAYIGGKLDTIPLPDLYLLPHNEHWSSLPLLAYRTLRASVGVGSYWPYLGVVPLVLAWRRRRYAVAAFGLPLLVYIMWHAHYGSSFEYPPNGSATVPLIVGAFVVVGLAAALTGYFGFQTTSMVTYLVVGLPILAGIVLACRALIANRT